jgi:hypothetical protein
MGMLFAKGLARLETIAERLLQNSKDGRYAFLVTRR